jgi:diphthamide biosynthesis methyltransferase
VLIDIRMLYLVGLGLSDETDITVKGLEVVKKASRVYLEAYTSILLVDQSVLVCILAGSSDNVSGSKRANADSSSRKTTMDDL